MTWGIDRVGGFFSNKEPVFFSLDIRHVCGRNYDANLIFLWLGMDDDRTDGHFYLRTIIYIILSAWNGLRVEGPPFASLWLKSRRALCLWGVLHNGTVLEKRKRNKRNREWTDHEGLELARSMAHWRVYFVWLRSTCRRARDQSKRVWGSMATQMRMGQDIAQPSERWHIFRTTRGLWDLLVKDGQLHKWTYSCGLTWWFCWRAVADVCQTMQ